MPRPFWSGQVQISLVSFGVSLFPAVEAKSEIQFHQLSRKTGERIHHKKVVGGERGGGESVEKDEIVKGYEYRKGEYITIEPSEIENLRIPSRRTITVSQFVDVNELGPELYEKPYFVVPDGENQTEAFTVIRKALQSTKKVALGKVAFGGREHLIAIAAPRSEDDDTPEGRGMMAYTIRYAQELRAPASYFSSIKMTNIDPDQLALAEELIHRKASRYAPETFHDEYETALKEMIAAKVDHSPLPKDTSAPRSAKIINLMDALRKSVATDSATAQKVMTAAKSPKQKNQARKKGLSLVSPSRSSKSNKVRKSA